MKRHLCLPSDKPFMTEKNVSDDMVEEDQSFNYVFWIAATCIDVVHYLKLHPFLCKTFPTHKVDPDSMQTVFFDICLMLGYY